MLDWILQLFDFMPVEASSWASRVDFINNVITVISVFCTVGITVAMIFFSWKYRRKSENQKTEYITHNVTLETIWTVIPTIVCIVMFYFGYTVYHEMRNPPVGANEVFVKGQTWYWDFQYANGKKSTGELVVPIGEPVKLIMTSADVLHSFFIPAMRVKEDMYNGNYSYLWFTPTVSGVYDIFCTEYCGTQHSGMTGKLKVVSKEAYNDWLNEKKDPSAEPVTPEVLGKTVYTAKCAACHSVDGTKVVGPTFKGIYSGAKHVLQDGTEVAVDDNYIRNSVANPQAQIVAGYPPVMPAFQLTEDELIGVISYMKTLK